MECRILHLDVSAFTPEAEDEPEPNLILLEIEGPRFRGVYASPERAAQRLAAIALDQAAAAPCARNPLWQSPPAKGDTVRRLRIAYPPARTA